MSHVYLSGCGECAKLIQSDQSNKVTSWFSSQLCWYVYAGTAIVKQFQINNVLYWCGHTKQRTRDFLSAGCEDSASNTHKKGPCGKEAF